MEENSCKDGGVNPKEDSLDLGHLIVNTFGLIIGLTITFLPTELKSNFIFTFAIILNIFLYGYVTILHRKKLSVFCFYMFTTFIWILNSFLQIYRIFV